MKKILNLLALLSVAAFFSCNQNVKDGDNLSILLNEGWKIKAGDNPDWADPALNDSGWKDISPTLIWESQNLGMDKYDGYAWYRINFYLISALKDQSYFKDSLYLNLGMIDDNDQVFLNGKFIGENCKKVNEPSDKFSEVDGLYNKIRKYTLATNDERLHWGMKNVLAIKVFDRTGGGGLYGGVPFISMIDIKDMIVFDNSNSPFEFSADSCRKLIKVKNLAANSFTGQLIVVIKNMETSMVVSEIKKEHIELKARDIFEFAFSFKTESNIPESIEYSFIESNSNKKVSLSEQVPYILTPKPKETPRINSAKVYGARPGRPFLYTIAASGLKPMTYNVSNLPDGLTLDSNTGIIKGSVKKAGEYIVNISVKNVKGESGKAIKFIIGDQIALTPPMGWNSWNCWGLSVSDQKVKQTADLMISTGLADHGWTYINIDDGWEAPERAKDGSIVPNEKFPDMKLLCQYVHDKGLKIGIYSSPGPKTCGGYLGSYQHELQDLKTYSAWGIDYLKYDWCSYSNIAKGDALKDLKEPYIVMQEAMKKTTERDIVYSLCQYGMGNVWEWGGQVGGNLWRCTGDITDTWESMSGIGFNQDKCAPYSKQGNWNDPDMMIVGWVGWGPTLHPSRLTVNEQYTHVSLWCLLSAPLLLGNDLSRLDDFTMNLLTNDEVIEIDQDPLGKQAVPIVKSDDIQILAKDLEDGSKAVGLFNLTNYNQQIVLNLSDLKLNKKQKVRDLWRQKDLGQFETKFETIVFPHGVVLVKVIPE